MIDWRLYAIIDRSFLKSRNISKVTESLAKGGAGVIQLRDKSGNIRHFYEDALEVLAVTRRFEIPLIINDRVDVALAAEADGLHVGQDDLPVSVARELLGKEKLLGVSVHNHEEFEKMDQDEVDYFGVGTIFSTTTKSHLPASGTGIISTLKQQTNKPLIAIGGITPENTPKVINAGANGVAVISALLTEKDVEQRARQFFPKT